MMTTPQGNQTRSSHAARNVAIAIFVIAVIAVSYVALDSAGIMVVQKSTVMSVTYSTTETPQSSSNNIVNGLITVSPGNYEYYQVSVPAGAYNVQLSGTFTASGGSGNDIIVSVMDQTDFVNWQNGHQASTYYDSGQVTTDSFSVTLPAGAIYYLVYSNEFSIISTKNVNTQANLSYTENVPSIVTYTTTYVTS